MRKIIALLLLVVMSFTMLVSCGDIGIGGNKVCNHNYVDGVCELCGIEDPGYVPPDENVDNKVRYDVPEVGYDGSEVTITFSHTMGESLRNELDAAITRFNELFPNIKIEHAQIGGYDDVRDQIKNELTAGNQPNIAYCYPDHVALYNVTKKTVPLDNFIESTIEVTDALGNKTILGLTEEQIADFIPGYYKEGTVFDTAGTMYTMPMSKSTEVLYYNKTFFKENNLTVPTTWEEMYTVAKQIQTILLTDDNTSNDADKPLGYDSESNWFITMAEQYGSPYTSTDKANHFLFNNKTNRDFVTMFRGWYEEGLFTTQELYGSYTSALFTNTDPEKPTCYMCIGSSAGASHQVPAAVDNVQPFEVGIAPIPQVDPDKPKAISQGPSLVIFDQPNKQEVVASWLFVKFLTTDAEFQASFSMASGYMPVIKSVTSIPTYASWLESANGNSKAGTIALSVKTAFENSDYYFVSPAFNGSSKARDQVGALLQTCFTKTLDGSGFSTVDELIRDAFQKAINECLSDL